MNFWEFFFGEFSFILFAIFLIVIVILLSKFVGKFPTPLALSEEPKREIKEVLSFWAMMIIWLYISSSIDSFFIGLSIGSFINLIIPISYVFYVNKWKLKDLGLTPKIESWSVALFSIACYILLGIYCFFRLEQREIYWYYLLLLLYSNAFLEEFFFRAVIQSKLERALGQKRALIYQGILFMLIHIPANLIRFLNDANLVWFIWNFSFQLLHGTIYGLIYMKTRNLIPSVICHYLTNWTGAIIMLLL